MGQYGVFSLFKSYGVKKPTSLCMCLPQHDMAPMERHLVRYFGLFWFFQSLTAGYKLPGIVRERDSSVQLVQGFFVSVYFPCSLTRALSKSLPHVQQLFSASTRTPGQILAPRVCTLVLFIVFCVCVCVCVHDFSTTASDLKSCVSYFVQVYFANVHTDGGKMSQYLDSLKVSHIRTS